MTNEHAPKPHGTRIVSRVEQYASLRREHQIRNRQRATAPIDPELVEVLAEIAPQSAKKLTAMQLEGLKNCRKRVRRCPCCGQSRTEKHCECRKAVNERREARFFKRGASD